MKDRSERREEKSKFQVYVSPSFSLMLIVCTFALETLPLDNAKMERTLQSLRSLIERNDEDLSKRSYD